MAKLTSTVRIRPFIVTEASGQRSRENIIVTQTGTAVESGTILTKSGDTGTAVMAMDAGSTGNPTSGTITVGPKAVPGVYRVVFTAATKFDVEDPNGKNIGSGTLGVLFNKAGISFTPAAGGTPAVAGDQASITVAEGDGKYIPYTAAGAAGTADAILYERLPAYTGDKKAVAITDDCEVNRFELNANMDAAAEADLRKRGIKVRSKVVPKITTPTL